VGFLILCAAIAVILIAMRINAWSKTPPPRRIIVEPEAQAVPLAQPEDEPLAMAQPPPDQPTATPAPTQAADIAAPVEDGDAEINPPEPEGPLDVLSPEPASPLDVLSPKIADVPPELADQVVTLMSKHQEVSAVRLLCDELRIGILDAQKTARSLIGR
jgi:hypothetical protein